MPIQNINIGSYPNDGTGNPLRLAFDLVNQNNAVLQGQIDTKIAVGDELPMSGVTGLQTALNDLNVAITAVSDNLVNYAGVDVYDMINSINDLITQQNNVIIQQSTTISAQQDTINYILSIINQ